MENGLDSLDTDLPENEGSGGTAVREPGTKRALIALELRAYRERVGGAIQRLRPDCEVAVVHPGELDREVRCMAPALVICNRPNDLVGRRSAWVHFHSAESEATVRIGRRCLKRGDVDLEDLLSLLDWAVSSHGLEATVPA